MDEVTKDNLEEWFEEIDFTDLDQSLQTILLGYL